MVARYKHDDKQGACLTNGFWTLQRLAWESLDVRHAEFQHAPVCRKCLLSGNGRTMDVTTTKHHHHGIT